MRKEEVRKALVPQHSVGVYGIGADPEHGKLRFMPDETHPLKQALIDLAEWHDRWREETGLEPLVDAVCRAWIGYVAANCEIPRGKGEACGRDSVETAGEVTVQ